MKKLHDYMACSGNICVTDPEKHLRTWIVGEPTCSNKPYTKWQKVQAKINRLLAKGKLKNTDSYFYLADLEKVKRVTLSTTGIVFDSRADKNQGAQQEKVAFNTHGSSSNNLLTTHASSHARPELLKAIKDFSEEVDENQSS